MIATENLVETHHAADFFGTFIRFSRNLAKGAQGAFLGKTKPVCEWEDTRALKV